MAIADKLTKLSTDITNAYEAIEDKGGTIPANKNTDNLEDAIRSISSGHLDNTEYQEANDDLDDILEVTPYYTQLEFIQSTGLQYINTEITAKSSISTKIVFEASNNNSDFQSVFGGDGGSSRNYRGLAFDINNSGQLTYNYYGDTKTNASLQRYDNVLIFESYYNSAMIVSYNNKISQAITSTRTTSFTYDDVNTYIFARCRDNTPICHSNLKLYSCKIWDNEELVRDFIPAKNENGVVCLYDKVNKEFYYNQGTGDFIGGDEV